MVLVAVGGVVALGLEDRREGLVGGEVGAGFADRLELAVELGWPVAVSVAEEFLVDSAARWAIAAVPPGADLSPAGLV